MKSGGQLKRCEKGWVLVCLTGFSHEQYQYFDGHNWRGYATVKVFKSLQEARQVAGSWRGCLVWTKQRLERELVQKAICE